MTTDTYNPEKKEKKLIQRKAGIEKQRDVKMRDKQKTNYLKVQLFPREDSKGGIVEL